MAVPGGVAAGLQLLLPDSQRGKGSPIQTRGRGPVALMLLPPMRVLGAPRHGQRRITRVHRSPGWATG